MSLITSIAVAIGAQQKSSTSQPVQTVTDALLTEESDYYITSEDELNVYLQLETI